MTFSREMAVTSIENNIKTFKASLGNYQLALLFDAECSSLLVKVANASSLEWRRKFIFTSEEVHQITGAQLFNASLFFKF